MNTSE